MHKHFSLLLSLTHLFSLSLSSDAHENFCEQGKTLHVVCTNIQNFIRWKVALFPRNNTGIRINISSLSASTLIRECVSFSLSSSSLFFFSPVGFDIPKTEGYRDISISGSFAFKKVFFLPFRLQNPSRELCAVNPNVKFDFETKVWDKMPTERETYYLSYLAALIGLFFLCSRRNFAAIFAAR